MAPHLEEVETQKLQAVALKEKIAGLKKKRSGEEELKPLRDALVNAERSSREAQSRADAIDAAVYDLKAVNPKARVVRDTRRPLEIIEAIAQHGRVGRCIGAIERAAWVVSMPDLKRAEALITRSYEARILLAPNFMDS